MISIKLVLNSFSSVQVSTNQVIIHQKHLYDMQLSYTFILGHIVFLLDAVLQILVGAIVVFCLLFCHLVEFLVSHSHG